MACGVPVIVSDTSVMPEVVGDAALLGEPHFTDHDQIVRSDLTALIDIRAIAEGIVMMDKWDAEETLRLIDEHKITHTHMVATMFHRLLGLPDEVRSRYDTSSLRFLIHGAAPCPVHVKHAMIEWLGAVSWEYYAASEGGGGFGERETSESNGLPYQFLQTHVLKIKRGSSMRPFL